jgi:proton-dependent oligopeptide transporter, POT family
MALELEKPAEAVTNVAAKTSHPLGFWFFFWGEFSERCSYYGMKTILPVYLTGVLHFTDTRGSAIMNFFKMAVYLLPLLGGYLADRFFGKYWTIVGFSVPYVLGHFVLGIPNYVALTIALLLLACGSGVIKPNISTLMGLTYDQKRPGQEQLRASAFLWFYFAINIGALISTFSLPLVTAHYGGSQHGYAVAFQVPAWLMVAALIVFASGKPFYATETLAYREPTPAERQERRKTMLALASVFGLIFFFWVGYEFNDNVWIYFIRDYVNLDADLSAIGLSKGIKPEQLQTINPAVVMIFAPLFAISFRALDPNGRVFTAGNKMFAGFIMITAASAAMAAAGFIVGPHATAVLPQDKVSIAWPVAAYVLLTLAEILIYGTGLEYAYAAAPANMKGFVTGCFLALDAAANFVNAWLAQLYGGSLVDPVAKRGPLPAGQFFTMAALIGLAATIAFFFVARKMNRRPLSASS